ncbi:MAG TPA: NADH-quinone oxidoreductase subunit J [Candidatus Thermoplasmatota archaeon]|nr:NADH-quinone oxidoreductase subunit J [Candidatus Thermoplasmatota archaeon]
MTGLSVIAFVEGSPLNNYAPEGGSQMATYLAYAVLAVLAGGAGWGFWNGARSDDRRRAGTLFAGGVLALGAAGYLAGLPSWGLAGVLAGLVLGSAMQIFVLVREKEITIWALLAAVGLGGLAIVAGAMLTGFFATALLMVFAGLKVVSVRENIHATVWLAALLIGVAAFFLLVGAEFLAAIQILVYVGAVITLILFTVMLTLPQERPHSLDELDLPPGFSVESVEDLQTATPAVGVGPMKSLVDTNPRKPVREPGNLYGVSIDDGVYGTETQTVAGTKKKEGSA